MNTPLLRGVFCAVLTFAVAALPVMAETTLVVGKANPQAESIMTVNVGDDAGIFKKHGLTLEIQDFNGGYDFQLGKNLDVGSFVQYEHWKFPALLNHPESNVAVSVQLTYKPSWLRK